jgi:Protein of unknown function (DUF3485)
MRILIGLIILVAAEIGIRMTCGVMTPLPAILPQHSLNEIPKEVVGWTAEDQPIDKPLFEHTGAAVMLDRNYYNGIGDNIAANFGIWLNTEMSLPHSPELCYGGAGWQIIDRKRITIPLQQGGRPARILTLDKTGQALYVLYCYQIGERIVLDSDELRSVRQALRGSRKNMPPVVKMMLQSNNPDAVIAQRQLTELAAELLPKLAPYN